LILNDFVVSTLSYFDAKGKDPENVYLGFIAGMLIGLEPEYKVTTNRESGYGRYDVMVKPKDKQKPAFILELKSLNKTKHKDPKKAIQEALKQINDRGYEKELLAQGYNNITKLAIVSDGKEVWVKEDE
ncbi:PD-(D/E)XK nuclease superfamily protein, partial [Desulfonauticus submarinus]